MSTIIRCTLEYAHQHGTGRRGFRLRSGNDALDNLFLGWTASEAEDSLEQFNARRARLGFPVVTVVEQR